MISHLVTSLNQAMILTGFTSLVIGLVSSLQIVSSTQLMTEYSASIVDVPAMVFRRLLNFVHRVGGIESIDAKCDCMLYVIVRQRVCLFNILVHIHYLSFFDCYVATFSLLSAAQLICCSHFPFGIYVSQNGCNSYNIKIPTSVLNNFFRFVITRCNIQVQEFENR